MRALREQLPQTDDNPEHLYVPSSLLTCFVLTSQGRDRSHRGLTGELPSELWRLSTLCTLSLSRNELTGRVPQAISHLTNLTFLDLSHNRFLGDIPSALGTIASLRHVDLSYNQFTGPLPSNLAKLGSLETLNVSMNPLCGRVPEEYRSWKGQSLVVENSFLGAPENVPEGTRTSNGMESLLHLHPIIPELNQLLAVSEGVATQLKQVSAKLEDEEGEIHRDQLWSLLPPDSAWRLWIPLSYWLQGDPLPTWVEAIPATWDHINTEQVLQSVRLIHRFSPGNPLHMIAYFGAHAFLQQIPIPLPWFKAYDQYGRTPLQTVIQRTQQEEQRKKEAPERLQEVLQSRIDRYEFCMRELCSQEAELNASFQRLIQQNGSQDPQRQEYTVEEHVLMNSLRGMIQHVDSYSLVGSILRIHQELEAFIEIGECSERDKFWLQQCASWLPRVIQIHWRGLQPLESHKKAYAHFKRSGLRKFSPFSKGEAKGLLQAVCRQLRKALPLVEHFLQLRCPKAYVEVQKWLLIQENAPSIQSGTWLHDLELGSVLMIPAAGDNLLPRSALQHLDDELVSETLSYQQVQFTCLTDSRQDATASARLDIEYAVAQLSRFVVGHGKRATRVVQLNRDDRSVIMIAERHASGVRLSQVLSSYPDLLWQCQHENYAEMAFMSMLLDLKDPTGDHYLLELEYDHPADGDVQTRRVYLLDLHSSTPILDSTCTSMPGGNILYLNPMMDQPVPSSSRQKLLGQAPEVVLMEWFEALYRQNMKYRAMCEAGVYSHSDLHLSTTGDGQGVQLSIRRVPSTAIPCLYERMTLVYDYLMKHEQATLHDLLTHLDPGLSSLCQMMREDGRTQWPSQVPGSPGEECAWIELKDAIQQLLDLMPSRGIQALWDSSRFERYQFLLPDSTSFMHSLITSQRLTPTLVQSMIDRGADVQQLSEEGEFPINLAIQHYHPDTPALLEALANAKSPLDRPNRSGLMITDIIEDHMSEGPEKVHVLEVVATLLHACHHGE